MGELVGVVVVLSVLGVVLPLALMHGFNRTRRQAEAWRKLAARHHFHFSPGRRLTGPRVSGSLGGREFILEFLGGKKSESVFVMDLRLNGRPPIDWEDGVAKVGAADPDEAAAYATERRQQASAELAELGGSMTAGNITIPVHKMLQDLEALEHAVNTLGRVAPILDVA